MSYENSSFQWDLEKKAKITTEWLKYRAVLKGSQGVNGDLQGSREETCNER